jgi:hypothetical protein
LSQVAVNQATAIGDGLTEMSEALVSMAKLGDSDAFVELSKLHSDEILQTIYRVTGTEGCEPLRIRIRPQKVAALIEHAAQNDR